MPEKTKNFVALKQVLAEILEEIRNLSGCQCVGIRLRDNGDFPYYVHEGFPKFFIFKENSLCARDDNGNHILDEMGNPLLDCMCGNVIKGQIDPKLPFFTEKGSFWTNSTTQLLKTSSDKELQGRTRNMCHNNGYESVALIPMQVGDRTLGLIQIDDPRENMFTLETIKKYELIADHVGTVVFNALEIQQKMGDFFNLVNKFKNSSN